MGKPSILQEGIFFRWSKLPKGKQIVVSKQFPYVARAHISRRSSPTGAIARWPDFRNICLSLLPTSEESLHMDSVFLSRRGLGAALSGAREAAKADLAAGFEARLPEPSDRRSENWISLSSRL